MAQSGRTGRKRRSGGSSGSRNRSASSETGAEEPLVGGPARERERPAPHGASGSSGREAWIAAAAALALLLPFVTRPVHIDDTLFVAAARHIAEHPLDPYGFGFNWYHRVEPFAEITQNPPLSAYWLAIVGAPFAFSVPALHLGMLVPTLAGVLGMLALARRWTANPLLAVGASLLTPAFVVSGSTLMSDVPMLALYVWALECWLVGLEREKGRVPWLAAGLALAAVASLTKYLGISVIGLMGVATLAAPRSRWSLLPWLALPCLALLAYDQGMQQLYGAASVTAAANYTEALEAQLQALQLGPATLSQRLVSGLAFLGGAFLPILFFAAGARALRAPLPLGAVAGLGIVAAASLLLQESATPSFWLEGTEVTAALRLQALLFVWGGLALLALAGWDLARRPRDPGSWVLVAWLAGIFVFNTFVNWTMNVRSLVPAIPAAGFLVLRLIEGSAPMEARALRPLGGAAVAALVLSWLVAAGDAEMARHQRAAAARVVQLTAEQGWDRVLFQGHWGFQHYMEEAGFTAFDVGEAHAYPLGTVVVRSRHGYGAMSPGRGAPHRMVAVSSFEFPARWPIETMNLACGAGFYSNFVGTLPYAFCRPEGPGRASEPFQLLELRALEPGRR